jgi:hypothetical protein
MAVDRSHASENVQYRSAIRLCDDKFGDNLTGEDRSKIPNMGSGIVGISNIEWAETKTG